MKIAVLLVSVLVNPGGASKAGFVNYALDIMKGLEGLKADMTASTKRIKDVYAEKSCFCAKENARISKRVSVLQARSTELRAVEWDKVDYMQGIKDAVSAAKNAFESDEDKAVAAKNKMTSLCANLVINISSFQDIATQAPFLCSAPDNSCLKKTELLAHSRHHLRSASLSNAQTHQAVDHLQRNLQQILRSDVWDKSTHNSAQKLAQALQSPQMAEGLCQLFEPMVCQMQTVKEMACNFTDSVDDFMSPASVTATAGKISTEVTDGSMTKAMQGNMSDEVTAEEAAIADEIGGYTTMMSTLTDNCEKDTTALSSMYDKSVTELTALETVMDVFASVANKQTFSPGFLQLQQTKQRATSPTPADIVVDIKSFITRQLDDLETESTTDKKAYDDCASNAVSHSATAMAAAQSVDAANADLSVAEADTDSSYEAIADAKVEIEKLETTRDTLTVMRETESQTYDATVAELDRGMKLLQDAVDVLNGNFSSGTHNISSLAGGSPLKGFDNSNFTNFTAPANETVESKTIGTTTITPASVIGMIYKLISRMQFQKKMIEYAENDAVANYDATMEDLKNSFDTEKVAATAGVIITPESFAIQGMKQAKVNMVDFVDDFETEQSACELRMVQYASRHYSRMKSKEVLDAAATALAEFAVTSIYTEPE